MMERFIVEGGRRLEGSIRPGGNKNAALPILAACLLTDDAITLRNLPDIQDVRVMLQIMEGLGASVERLEPNVVRIHVMGECSSNPDPDLSRKIRASILLAGPLLARCGAANIAKPGGDAIGRRRVDTHLLALESLGAQIEVSAQEYRMSVRALR
ncbi:MAG TPA: UDP-N-acetylglucosamine 1-carboxyvinyltransferase, partial [Thermoanaerobaculia bacterium]|nr:UDP-N-acetylglucosamine 1-carboxyvinyltransferase [Thermoanaerobaculia bacterium]